MGTSVKYRSIVADPPWPVDWMSLSVIVGSLGTAEVAA
jgi:hypothetical protein